MKPLLKFTLYRNNRAIIFALPIIIGVIALGIIVRLLKRYMDISQDTQDAIAIVGMVVLVVLVGIVIFSRRFLPGILGAWQKRWNEIPRWRDWK